MITDFIRKQGYYLNLSQTDDIYVTKHGEVVILKSTLKDFEWQRKR